MKLILCSLLVATLPFGSVLADAPKEKNAKVTLVYQHELPNVPGKSIKGVLVEYGPGGYSPGHTHPKSAFIYATVLEGAIRSQVNDGPVTTYKAGQSFSELPGDRHAVSANASKSKPAKLLAVFVVDTNETELTYLSCPDIASRENAGRQSARPHCALFAARPRCPVVAQSRPNELAPHHVPIKRINSSVLFSLNFSPDWREPCHYAAGMPPSCACIPAPARQSVPENFSQDPTENRSGCPARPPR